MPEHAPDEKPEPPAGTATGASSGTERQPDAAAAETPNAGAAQGVPLAALTTTDLVHSFLSLLALKAWEGMGLVPNALTGKTQKDIADARLAIDAYAAVFEILRSRVDEGPRREMENLLTTLRLNFVDKSAG